MRALECKPLGPPERPEIYDRSAPERISGGARMDVAATSVVRQSLPIPAGLASEIGEGRLAPAAPDERIERWAVGKLAPSTGPT